MSPEQEKLLADFLRWAAAADFAGKLERLDESMGRLYDLFLRENEERRKDLGELRGDIRGVSLRVGALERGSERLEERTRHLEGRDADHERSIDESHRWIVGDLERKKTKAEARWDTIKDPRSIVAVLSALVALATGLWHLLH